VTQSRPEARISPRAQKRLKCRLRRKSAKKKLVDRKRFRLRRI